MTQRRGGILLSTIIFAAVGCVTTDSDVAPQSTDEQSQAAFSGTAFVHLFEWRWLDIARECEEFLGPKGFEAVQISPPHEHISHSEWWARYQPVSYQLESRSGTRSELIEMVQRCDAAGVAIYADMIINHTAKEDGGGVGHAGSTWSRKVHPAIGYTTQHYHSECLITNYYDAGNVQYCELEHLPDLDTANPYVQGRIAAYMRDLLDIGVAGFRIDAAKHVPPGDIEAILAQAGNPYVFLEVIGSAGEAVQPASYTHIGQVTELDYSRDMGQHFHNGKIADLRYIGDNKLSTFDAIVFTDNHDSQRGHGAGGDPVTFHDGSQYNLANAFMLAWPYGYPKVMSSYQFTDPDHGPPAGASDCDQPGWVCEHRWTTIANMVQFRNTTNGENVTHWWDNGNDRIAFGRGDRGFIAINNEGGTLRQTFQTGLGAGVYCNIAGGEVSGNGCTSSSVFVDSNGLANIYTAPYEATAIHANARLSTPQSGQVFFTCHNGNTYSGQSVYVVGSIPQLGQWDVSQAVKLDPNHYPSWEGFIAIGTDQTFEWKCVKREESNPNAGVEWQGGSNNVTTTPSTGAILQNASF